MNETKPDLTEAAKPLVVVVDDDESVREAMTSLLRSVGYCADAFDSAEEFLISGRLPETDCLILDVKMPGMGGIALREMLAGINPPLPTVFITAHGDEATRRLALSLGAVDFLSKPFHDEALLGAVRLALETSPARTT
jgi:FixJ family two-component response regulator